MSARNPIYDTPTPAEIAAREKRERERKERVTRQGPVETAISNALSAFGEWTTSRGQNAETDQQGIARRAREKQERQAEEARILAQRAEENRKRVEDNTQQPADWQKVRGGSNSGSANPVKVAQAASAQQEVAKGTAGTAGAAVQGAQGVAAPLPKAVIEERLRGEGVNENTKQEFVTANEAFSNTRTRGPSFNIGRFRAEVSSADSVLPTHSFLVVFSPMPWALQKFPSYARNLDSILTMRCDNVVLPSINLLQEQNIRRYGFGPVENVAYGVNVGDFTLQFIVDKNAFVVQFFEEWLNRIVNRDSFGGANINNILPGGRRPYEIAYKDTYACSSINVFVYDRSQNNIMEYNIYDAFPTGIQSMNMSWSEENELMKLNITFSFTDLRIKQSAAKKNQDAPFSDEIKVTAKGLGITNPFATANTIDPSGSIAQRLVDPSNDTVIIGNGFASRGSVTPVQLSTPSTSQTADVTVPKDYTTTGVRINIAP